MKREDVEVKISKIQKRAYQLIAISGYCKTEIKKLKMQIFNLKAMEAQAHKYMSDTQLLGGEAEPEFEWHVYSSRNSNK